MAEQLNNRSVAVQVSGVKKMYKLGQIGGGTLQADLQSWWARKRGKEDPNTKIGEGERSHGDTFMALNGIDLTIYQGEAVGIIGSNGAGKSTLLKLLSKVTAPTEGEIDIYGRIASMLEVGTGFNGELTGRENIYMNGAILGMTKAEIDAKMEQIIDFSEVREFIDTPVKRYSSGMFVKLAFSVAAHLDSEIMIMDEVLAVGDMAFQKKCLNKMKEAANQDGRTVLYVSHNMSTIRTLCERCIVLDKGKIKYFGDIETAIRIYMNYHENSEDELDVDISKRNHISSTENKTIIMNAIHIKDREKLVYHNGEFFCFDLDFDYLKKVDDLGLRVSLSNSAGFTVGTSYSNHLEIRTCKNNTVSIRLALRGIREGDYYISVGFFGLNTYNLPFCHDFVSKVIKIQVIKNPDCKEAFLWNTEHYGNIEFDTLVVEGKEE